MGSASSFLRKKTQQRHGEQYSKNDQMKQFICPIRCAAVFCHTFRKHPRPVINFFLSSSSLRYICSLLSINLHLTSLAASWPHPSPPLAALESLGCPMLSGHMLVPHLGISINDLWNRWIVGPVFVSKIADPWNPTHLFICLMKAYFLVLV